MKRIRTALCLFAALQWLGMIPADAQIPYVTVRTPKSPVPPGVVLQTNAPAAAALGVSSAAPAQFVARPRLRPSLDKAELERRVVAFQQKRALEGSASAQYELGVRYLDGNGVVKDLATARRWLKEAASSGNSDARRKLAELERTPR